MTRPMWYDATKAELPKAVFGQVAYIKRQLLELREDMLFYLELYANGNVSGLGSISSLPASRLSEYMYRARTGATRLNVCAAAVDTASSLISQSPAIPQYLTIDGDFKLIRKAEKCTQVLQGQFHKDVQEVCKRAQLDALKTGIGFVHGYVNTETGIPDVERVHPLEMLVEHLDGMNQKPRSIHRDKVFARETLKAMFPAKAHLVDLAPPVSRDAVHDVVLQGLGQWSYDGFVEVVESWHLPAGKKKGRHSLCIGNTSLVDEDYDHPDFPFAVFRYRERDYGYYGAGLIESVLDAQNRINDLIAVNQKAQNLLSNVVIFNPNGEGSVSNEAITNDIGIIFNYDAALGGQPPTMQKWSGTLDDLQEQISIEFERALMVEGLSMSQVNGQGAGKGLDSGVAVRAADDVQSRRLLPFVSRYQSACMGVARLFERINDDLADNDPKYEVSGASRRGTTLFLKTARWKEVRLPKGNAQLVMAQMSALPTTPAAKFQAVSEWIQGGFVSRTHAMALLEVPDIDAYASVECAHLAIAKWQIEQRLDGIMPEPDPRQDIALALDLGTKSKLKAATLGADWEVLDAFEAYLVALEDLQMMAQQQAQAAEAAAQAVAQPMPGAGPGPAPTGLPVGTKGVVAPGLGQLAGMVG